MNPGIKNLHPYPFEKIATLKQGLTVNPALTGIDLSIGEPKHETPPFILEELAKHLPAAGSYPKTSGSPELRQTISEWLSRRFQLPPGSLNPEKHILPVNGTREALFAVAQCIVDGTEENATVVMPNPFYQIYEGAALLAGATPYYLNCTVEHNFSPDFSSVPASIWKDCQLVYICSPGNPAGNIISHESMQNLMELSDQYQFIIAADECYSEIYADESRAPQGLLQVAADLGRIDYKNCLVFHSLSKRSSLPGLRSGFVAGDASVIRSFLRYRTYHGCAMPGFAQSASNRAWQDEIHVLENRRLYREKFAAVLAILQPVLNVSKPEAGFYLWPEVSINDTEFAAGLYSQQNITVLPGSYLSRTVDAINPGENRLRIALVASQDECVEAAKRIREFINTM